ncbi:hypothetical protein F6X38_10735 [Aureimonas leprariae]|uniref:HTH cro/C1-type domain-containing protein n=2 Tax=Plantimonas leprariae TaxID=2615207 RepID=A0A7V7TWX3_9HYPH|nr:hypothetical protein F6X38_10735 [Aureimonas leprariae]
MEVGIPAAKAFRVYSDTSIPELAEATQLEAGRICMIEAGVSPTLSEADAIGRALDMPTALLVEEF